MSANVYLALFAVSAGSIVAQEADFAADILDGGAYLEDYQTYLDSISNYLPSSVVKFISNRASRISRHYQETCVDQNAAADDGEPGECIPEEWRKSALAWLLLLGAFVLTQVLIRSRSRLKERVGQAESDKLINRRESGFTLGSFFYRSTSSAAGPAKEDVDERQTLEDELNSAPGHLHTLSGKKQNTVLLGRAASSDSLMNSSLHSISEDILTDTAGLEDVEPPSPEVQKQKLSLSATKLHTVAERLSEDTLEDCHAFTDVQHSRKLDRKRDSFDARGNETADHDHAALDCVEECEDELDNSNGDDGSEDGSDDDIDDKEDLNASTTSIDACPKRASNALFDLLHTVSSPEEMKELHDSRKEIQMSLSQRKLDL